MKYAVKNLVKKPGYWVGTLEWWESCACETKENNLEIKLYQETRPTLEDFKQEAGF